VTTWLGNLVNREKGLAVYIMTSAALNVAGASRSWRFFYRQQAFISHTLKSP